MEIIWRVISWEGENGGKGAGIKKYNLVSTKQEDVKNSIGNGVAKELIYMTHGHELKQGQGLPEGMVGTGWMIVKGEKLVQLYQHIL